MFSAMKKIFLCPKLILCVCVCCSSCLNGGRCVDGINSYSCLCAAGYRGSNCQHRVNPCDSLPCLNGATCSNQDGAYDCHCPFGFTGPRCEVRPQHAPIGVCRQEGGGGGWNARFMQSLFGVCVCVCV